MKTVLMRCLPRSRLWLALTLAFLSLPSPGPDRLQAESTSPPELPEASVDVAGPATEEAINFSIEPDPLPETADIPTVDQLRELLSTEVGSSTEPIETGVRGNVPSRLSEVARTVAPAVVSLRAWDAAGYELSRGTGFFVDSRGKILTDIQLVRPDLAGRIEYISASTGTGKAHRITGYWSRNLDSGLTLLQSDAPSTPYLKVKPKFDLTREQAVSIVALHGENDLSLADARIRGDSSRAEPNGLTVRGEDSPGEPGSPVIDDKGRVIAMISMRVPQGKWFNFATRLDQSALASNESGQLQPLTELGRVKSKPLAQDTRFFYAFEALVRGDTARATAQFLRVLKTYPRSPELWALLGLSFAKLGAKKEALECNRKAVALDPKVGQYWYQLAVSQLEGTGAAGSSAAREALERAVEMRPADTLAWLLLAEQKLLEKNYVGAEKALTTVTKLAPNSALASFLLGYSKGRHGDYDAAERAMRRSLEIDRKQGRVWFYLALLYAKKGRLNEAVQAYEETVRIQPEHPSAWRNLALLQRRLGRESASSAAFERHRRLGAIQN